MLVLDEPFSGLDPVAVDVMSAVLRERADAGVRLCDRVGIVQAGRIRAWPPGSTGAECCTPADG